MLIEKLTLKSLNLSRQYSFYVENFGFELVEKKQDSFFRKKKEEDTDKEEKKNMTLPIDALTYISQP